MFKQLVTRMFTSSYWTLRIYVYLWIYTPKFMYVNKCNHFMSPKGKFDSPLKLTTASITELDQINLIPSFAKNENITCENMETLKTII